MVHVHYINIKSKTDKTNQRVDNVGHIPVFLDKKEAGRYKNLRCKSKMHVSFKKFNVNNYYKYLH